MRAVAVMLLLAGCLLAAYVFLQDDGMDQLERAGRSVMDDVSRSGRSVTNKASDLVSNDDEPNAPATDADTSAETRGTDTEEQPQEPVRPEVPKAVIQLPGQAGEFNWGESVEDVKDSVNVAFSREADGLMVQSRPEDRRVYRYFFRQGKLWQVQLRISPAEGQSLEKLYTATRDEMKRRYGDLPDSRRTFWADRTTACGLSLDRDLVHVQLEYRDNRRD
jgi:hypothetical protein